MSEAVPISFYATPPHACNYLVGRNAVTVFADPRARMNSALYGVLIQHGYRRSGEHVYAPHCPSCNSCQSLRIPVAEFTPNRAQRRNRSHNDDLEVRVTEGELNRDHFDLYQRYIHDRHRDGGMEEMDMTQCRDFLLSDWSDTRFIEFRLEGQLIGVAVMDVVETGLSAVYTFFDPAHARRGIGNFAILWLIRYAKHLGLPFVYLGYWIAESQKMAYKANYLPHQVFIQDQWIEVTKESS
ncbi:MAG: arginyltransferase [Gammaproteobacteria bacterium]|nr:arginyltransferase [Gammaproteobacteria bacterium]